MSLRPAVLDASAAVHLLLGRIRPGPSRDLIASSALFAPEHLDVEVLSVMMRLARARQITTEHAERLLQRLRRAPVRRAPVRRLLLEAWHARENLSACDAVYVALARRLACPLVTADRKLASAPRLDVPVVLLDL